MKLWTGAQSTSGRIISRARVRPFTRTIFVFDPGSVVDSLAGERARRDEHSLA